MTAMEVQCRCGVVRVQLEGEPLFQFYCHCDDCRAASGGAYSGVAVYPAGAVCILAGELAGTVIKTMPRFYCPKCGTGLMGRPNAELCGVSAQRLPPSRFQPEFHINCRFAVLPVKDALPHFAGFPPQFGGTDQRVGW